VSRAVLALGVAALGGCTLLNAPDPGRLDAGFDAPIPIDAYGRDATDAPICTRFERTCDDGDDEDCDGLVDCNDFDCATSLDCCGASQTVVPTESFDPPFPDWPWMPTSFGAITQPGPRLDDFGRTGVPRGVRVRDCVPIDLGARVMATLYAEAGTPVCGATACENYASIVLSPATDMPPGDPRGLLDELAVRVYHDGRAEVRRADEVLETAPTNYGLDPIAVTIELTPGVHTDGLAYVFATIRLQQPGIAEWTPFENDPFIPREHLVGAELGCTVARGLFLAFEGVGTNSGVDDVEVTRFECANPSHFQSPGTLGVELEAPDIGAEPGWTLGGVGEPAIASYRSSVSDPERWELAYDASNRDRALEGMAPVHYSIGGSYTTASGGLTMWTARLGSMSPRTAGEPILGFDPPDCVGAVVPDPPNDCSLLRSYREPGLYVPLDEADRTLLSPTTSPFLVAARQIPASRDFEIVGARYDGLPLDDSDLATLLSPHEGCASLRDPALLPGAPDGEMPFFLLYTCDPGDGTPTTIRAARLASPLGPATAEPGWEIRPDQLGRFAEAGVSSPDGAVWFVGATSGYAVYRIYFVAESYDGAPVLAFAEGNAQAWGELPDVVPYAGNPVLRSDDPLLGDCPTDGCDIRSVAVTRHADLPNRVRLYFGRTLEEDTSIRHVLTPLDQVWPALR
jgi:hypothetical protein